MKCTVAVICKFARLAGANLYFYMLLRHITKRITRGKVALQTSGKSYSYNAVDEAWVQKQHKKVKYFSWQRRIIFSFQALAIYLACPRPRQLQQQQKLKKDPTSTCFKYRKLLLCQTYIHATSTEMHFGSGADTTKFANKKAPV